MYTDVRVKRVRNTHLKKIIRLERTFDLTVSEEATKDSRSTIKKIKFPLKGFLFNSKLHKI